jgi:hypothetical protein
MARKLRLEFSGACYHVTNRGNYRRDLFAAKGAAAAFYRCLDLACTRFGWLVHHSLSCETISISSSENASSENGSGLESGNLAAAYRDLG